MPASYALPDGGLVGLPQLGQAPVGKAQTFGSRRASGEGAIMKRVFSAATISWI
jgi:hypothetical protein